MASRAEQKQQARASARRSSARRSSRRARRRRLYGLGGAVAIAAVIVVVAIAISSGGSSKPKTNGGGKGDVAAVTALLRGIPQSGNRLGDPSAPVTVDYYGDLECPVCRDFTLGALPQLISKEVRAGKVKLRYRSLQTATSDPSTFRLQQIAALAAGRAEAAVAVRRALLPPAGRGGQRLCDRAVSATDRRAGSGARSRRHGRAPATTPHWRARSAPTRPRPTVSAPTLRRGCTSPGPRAPALSAATSPTPTSRQTSAPFRADRTMHDRRIRTAMLIIGCIGWGIAAYLTYVHYQGLHPVCLANGGCEQVQSSRYAKLAGIPVATIGLVGYTLILGSLCASRRARPPRRRRFDAERLGLQRLPHLSRAVHDRRRLPMVRGQCRRDDRARRACGGALSPRRAVTPPNIAGGSMAPVRQPAVRLTRSHIVRQMPRPATRPVSSG